MAIIKGTNKSEALYGTESNDIIQGWGGNDLLTGAMGNDSLYGGNGNDTLIGSLGADSLMGGAGSDQLQGGAGNDWLLGQFGDDVLNDGIGSDTLNGGAGNDTLIAQGTSLKAGPQDIDFLTGGTGQDRFVFAAPQLVSPREYNAIITDFMPGDKDKIDLSGLGLSANEVWIDSYQSSDAATGIMIYHNVIKVESSDGNVTIGIDVVTEAPGIFLSIGDNVLL